MGDADTSTGTDGASQGASDGDDTPTGGEGSSITANPDRSDGALDDGTAGSEEAREGATDEAKAPGSGMTGVWWTLGLLALAAGGVAVWLRTGRP